jgi:hypothetical protein
MTAGRAFRVVKTPTDTHTTSMGVGVLSRADLERPSCPSCFRPGLEPGYCASCETSGAALRHLQNRARQ